MLSNRKGMKKEVLIELIDLLYQFDVDYQGDESYSLKDFVGFLNARVGGPAISMRKIEGEEHNHIQAVRQDSQSDTAILITLMFRYAKGYIKKALQESLIQTGDEFAFLITLMTYESMTKTELINKQVMEKTSGVEVIKRLLNQKMIREFADENDKRSVRVAITPKGKEEIEKILPAMAKVSRIVVGNLTQAEINTLSFLLKKLDFFHNEIFMNKRTVGLDQLLNDSIDGGLN
jgi:DNA-binding MarR family transcriptional regulator